MSKIKRIAAVLLAFVLAFAVLPASEAKAADQITLTGLGSFAPQDQFSRYWIRFTGLTAEQKTAVHQKSLTVYVDGVEKTATGFWNDTTASEPNIGFILPYDILEEGVTSYTDLVAPHNIVIKAGTEVAGTTIAQDFKFYVSGTSVVQGEFVAQPLAFTGLGECGAQDDSNQRYLLRFTGVDAATAQKLHGYHPNFYLDGEKTSHSEVYFWNFGVQGEVGFSLPYKVFSNTTPTTAGALESHVLTFKKGTYMGDILITEDFTINLDQYSITTPITFEGLGEGGAQDLDPANAGGTRRYFLRLTGLSATMVENLDKLSIPIYVGDEQKTGAFLWNLKENNGQIGFFVPYTSLNADAEQAHQVRPCTLMIKEGTVIGKYKVAEDFVFYVHQYGFGEGELQHTYDQKVENEATLVSAAECGKNAVYKYSCTCGEIGTETYEAENSALSHTGGTATCTAQAVCELCGEGYGELLAHTYDQKVENEATLVSAAGCGTNAVYKYSCTCGAIGTETYEAENTAIGSHTGGTATCTTQAVCERCGEGYGELLPHTGGTATCTAKAKCDACGGEYGELAAHTPEESVKNATFTAAGSIVTVCSACGEELSTKVTIAKVSSAKLSTTTYAYNGKVKTPSVTVKAGSKTLKKNVDYTVTLGSGRKAVGKYRVTITLKGNYSGKKYLYFTINPTETKVSKVKAEKKAVKVYFSKKTKEVTGYQIQYSTSKKFSGAKTKTLTKNKYSSYTVKSLKAKKTYYVRVRTYKTVGKTKFYSDWSNVKSAKTK